MVSENDFVANKKSSHFCTVYTVQYSTVQVLYSIFNYAVYCIPIYVIYIYITFVEYTVVLYCGMTLSLQASSRGGGVAPPPSLYHPGLG